MGRLRTLRNARVTAFKRTGIGWGRDGTVRTLLGLFPGLICVEKDPNIFKKITMLHIVSENSGPEINKKWDTYGVLFTRSSDI